MKRVISALLSVLLLGCLTACSRDDGQSKTAIATPAHSKLQSARPTRILTV